LVKQTPFCSLDFSEYIVPMLSRHVVLRKGGQ
jgi:hypothetical protein